MKVGMMAAIVVMLVSTGCSNLERDAKTAVARDMLDPGSVQFRDLKSYPADTSQHLPARVCGQYNAKNGLGGYVGFRVFRYTSAGKVSLESEEPMMAGNERLSATSGCTSFGGSDPD